MSGSHGHSHIPSAGARHRRPLTIAFVLVVGYMIVEIIAGIITGSLALLSDAGHMATDALGLGMALAAIVAASRGVTHSGRTFGLYRLEILAALANSILLLGVASYVLYEAVVRIQNPPPVEAGPMLVVALVGLVVNLIGWRLLRIGAQESINIKGAYYEVLADLFGSVGVAVAAVVMLTTGWPYADPIFAALVGLFIIPRAWSLGRDALRILLEVAPDDIDVEAVSADLAAISGVDSVHDLHIWTLTSEMVVATAHLTMRADSDPSTVLAGGHAILKDAYGIEHATLQVEDSETSCSEISW